MGKFQPLEIPDAGERKEQQELSLTAGGMQNGAGTLGDVWPFLTKLNILLLYHPEITLPGTQMS